MGSFRTPVREPVQSLRGGAVAAIAYPSYEAAADRPALRLVGSARRPSPATYRRRRLAAVAVLLLALAFAAVGVTGVVRHFSGSSAGSPGPAGGPLLVSSGVHVVQPGETYWSIADDLDRGDDTRATVDALVEANAGRPLRAGDRLVLPAP
jgi:hypothetical protein